MKINNCILLGICLTLALSKVSFINLNHIFTPSSSEQYGHYIQFIAGKNQQSTIISQNLQFALQQYRSSFFSAPEQVFVYVVNSQQLKFPQEQSNSISYKINGIETNAQSLAKQFKNLIKDISIKVIKKTGDSFDQLIQKHKENKEIVHILGVDKAQMKHFEKIVPVSSARKLQQKSSSQAPSTDSTYLIKFFFSILFVIVILAIIGFISDGSSKKDTLLYAKFIADVGNR